MGRKPKKRTRRSKRKIQPYDRVLISCEGERTEPDYLRALCADHRIASANVVVTGKSDSDPLSVVRYGIERFHADGDYDRLYCVFDRDTHDKGQFERAKQLVKQEPNAYSIVSYPCFEYWLLLHFEYTAKRYGATAGSPCNGVISDLSIHLPQYSKGSGRVYKATKDKIPTAVQHAKRRRKQKRAPLTTVDRLVTYLQQIRQG